MRLLSKAAVAALATGSFLALGPSQPATVTAASVWNAPVEARGGWLQRVADPSTTGAARGYVTFVNRASAPMIVDAVTSPLAVTVVLHSGALASADADGGLAHLYCGNPPADPPEGFVSGNFDTNPL